MRHLKTGVAALALTAFAIAPAGACSFGKSAQVKPKMTVADTAVVPQVDTDVSIATNDLSDKAVSGKIILPVPQDKPTD
ncbi:hypothetical protein LP7551_03096 [Roseibium album]|nr:hypothetical protein LP7551_03096 [Roseibium album]